MVEEMISMCNQCQMSPAEHKQEPVKSSGIPETAWHTLSCDFGGPYPDGHYNLVVIGKRATSRKHAYIILTALNPTFIY